MAQKAASGNTGGVRARPQNKQQQQQQQQQGYRTVNSRPTGGKQQMQHGRKRYGQRDYDKPQRVRNASVNIGADWNLLDEIEFSRLSKLSFGIPEAEDM